jgi:hypothetical protein
MVRPAHFEGLRHHQQQQQDCLKPLPVRCGRAAATAAPPAAAAAAASGAGTRCGVGPVDSAVS